MTAAPIPMTVRDVAHLTGLPVRTIQRWVLRGWLKDYGDGMNIYVKVGEVVDLADKRMGGRLHQPDEIANSVSVKEIAKQYKTTAGMVYKLACHHQWRRIRKGRSIYYDVVEVARTLGE